MNLIIFELGKDTNVKIQNIFDGGAQPPPPETPLSLTDEEIGETLVITFLGLKKTTHFSIDFVQDGRRIISKQTCILFTLFHTSSIHLQTIGETSLRTFSGLKIGLPESCPNIRARNFLLGSF